MLFSVVNISWYAAISAVLSGQPFIVPFAYAYGGDSQYVQFTCQQRWLDTSCWF